MTIHTLDRDMNVPTASHTTARESEPSKTTKATATPRGVGIHQQLRIFLLLMAASSRDTEMETKDEARKGPWTEEEDMQLMFFVGLLGERRWDFLAKVSGLRRTGKSCRLRWVNYLHPGLKRGRMSPQEERLVLELHARWGNRWSRIARKLPGRTDNEIKNYWRTHTRKEVQERRRNGASSPTLPPPPSSSSASPNWAPPIGDGTSVGGTCMGHIGKYEDKSVRDLNGVSGGDIRSGVECRGKEHLMDQIWAEIASLGEHVCSVPVASPPLWEYYECATNNMGKVGAKEAEGTGQYWAKEFVSK